MTVLGFLDPAAGPPARSPLHDTWGRIPGAQVAQRSGWTVPLSLGDPEAEQAACRTAAALADRSHLGKVELQAGPAHAGALAAAAEAATGSSPVPGTARFAGGAWWCPLTPTRLLVVGEAPAVDDDDVTATTVTAGFVALSLIGPRARDVLARVCALDLRRAAAGALLPGSVARVPGLVLCERDDALLVLAGSAHAQYLWDVLVDAGQPLGLVPAGLDAVDAVLAADREGVTHA